MSEKDDTRKVLLATAITLFGRHGFDAVTTRMLAAKAGVNVAAVNYHFGGKEDLYVSAIDHIASMLEPGLRVALDMATRAKSVAGEDPARRANLIAQIVETILTTLLEAPGLKSALPFVLRELFVPGPHFERLYRAVPQRIHETLTDLVAWILGLDPGSEEAIIRTQAVIGQLVVFHLGRPILLRRLGRADYTAADHAEIRRQVTVSVLASLGLPHALPHEVR